MGYKMNFLFIWCLLASIYSSHACTMEGVSTWQLPITVRIEDYFEGIVLQRAISDIGGFTLTSFTELNQGPYIVASIENSAFILRTNEAYRLFEEQETADLISLTYAFTCTNGQTPSSPITFRIEINDNNNNAPLFKTPDTAASAATAYEFTIATPVPPGFLINSCAGDVIVRDIDLTTYRIDFAIEDNPYIGIEYDEAASTEAKEFKAVLKSTAFIRSIPEPIILTISATDVDQTGDPPITRSTTVTIHGSSEFEMPLEPVFSQAFYLASYTENDQVIVDQPISLQQGYDELVTFTLEGDYAANFAISVNESLVVTLYVTNPLPTAVLQEAQIYLVVRASREYTSGASAPIVVYLPEAVHLAFERAHYEGEIVDNTLQLSQLILSQGYEGSEVNVTVEDYSSFFTATIVENTITLSMTPLDESIIQDNSFINLRVTASTASSSAMTIVTLEVVKDDVTTPVFGQTMYTGSYDPTAGLAVDPIVLVRGYDDTVNVSLSGEYASYFELARDGASSTLSVVGDLPSHILAQSHLHLSVEATKPRTVGASAVVAITLPGAREMQFEAQSYKGSVQDNILTLDTIILSVGYEEDVTFSLSGDYSTSFTVSSVQNQVTINMPAQLPQGVISENNFLMLTLTAEGLYALPTTAAVLLEIIKVDATTPVFSQHIYEGTYSSTLGIDMGNINLIQGYDSDVTFRIEGESSRYFSLTQNQNSVTLNVQSSIPEEVIFQEKVFVFNIFADKLLTVGANAAIVVKFSEELTDSTVMHFAKNTYVGSLENHELALEEIVLETGFAVGTQFYLSGDYAESFTHTVTDNIVTLSMTSELPTEVLENNKFIVLELEARRERAVSVVTGIIVDIIKEEIVMPVFNQAYYSGIYTDGNALEFQDTITLMQGFDETVTFGLEGESAAWFGVVQSGNLATVVLTSPLPQEVLDSHKHLVFTAVASKPNTLSGHAAISIELPTDVLVLEQEVLRFTQSSYEGQLNGSNMLVPTITLSNEITENVVVSLSGAFAAYFTVTRESNTIYIELMNEIPSDIISSNEFIVLDIVASKTDAVSGYTVLILSIVKDQLVVTPVFEQPYYTGEITEQGELLFEHTMRLIQGFDESVAFTLSGYDSERFMLTQIGENSLSLAVVQGGLEGMENNSHFVFSVVASKAGSVSGHAAIVIHNTDSSTANTIRFSNHHYKGSLEENVLTIELISIVEGYSSDILLTLSGDYVEYFQLVGQDGTYSLQLISKVSNEIIEAHSILLYTLEANGGGARTHATIIVELIKNDNDESETLAFDESFYVGSYSATSGVMDDLHLRVVAGYDSDIVFTLQGDNIAWFNVQHAESIVTISLTAPMPVELFVDNQPVIFVINAINSVGSTATATIVVSLEGELSDLTLLGFERNSYLGTIESDTSTLQPITLTQGYSSEVYFTLQGALSNYFIINQQGSTLNVELQNAIPEAELPSNRIIVLELQATAVQAVSAMTTIVYEVVDALELSFSAPYYIGQYSVTEGLVFDTVISLDVGYDQDVQFTLEGEHAQWFALEVQDNAISLIMTSAIPPAIVDYTRQLIFSVSAQKASNVARTIIVISLIDESTNVTILGFEQTSYLGSIENDEFTLEPIVLNEGYTEAVTFTLSGDLAVYFNLQQQGSTIIIVLESAIPEQTLPSNGIVMLELKASATQAITATTTVVIDAQRTNISEELAFSAAYYIGDYSEASGFVFDSIISLDVGYDENVQFALEGEHSQWFALEIQGNDVTLTLASSIPPAILVNNHQLVFIVTAQKPNSNIALSTLVISLIDDYFDATILGFERTSYLGSIENDALIIEPIILNQGYTDAVIFTLSGDLASYFNIQQQSATVNVVLQNTLPEQALPANGIVILDLRASAPESVPTTTTIVVEADRVAVAEELAFSAAYYIGEYSETTGLTFDVTISLDIGFDENVQFALAGEHAQWFALGVQGNAATLTMSSTIPPAILVNNHQLVFSITAQKPGSNMARSTAVISLVDDYSDASILGFERVSYLGSIENDALSIEPIVLNEGYTDAVIFTLSGGLASYFNLEQQGATVNLVLLSNIPDQALPANRIVVLELRAAALQSVPATATIVVEAQRPAITEELAFAAAYYTGEYSESGGLAFDSTISLDVGYDQDVSFTLEGDHVQWFALSVNGNSITLDVVEPIPPAVLVDLRKIIMIVRAMKSEITASTIVVISVVDNSGSVINEAFDKVLYEGTINVNVVQHEPITIAGLDAGIEIEIFGVYRELFLATLSGDSVMVGAAGTLNLPEGVTHVALELRAGGASAVVIFDVIQSETPELPTVAFESPSYVLRADMAQTGLLGLVQAAASNGESIAYSIAVDNAHLRQRISINSVGEIHLSAPANTGVYSFEAIATSTITQIQATAAVHLTVEAAATCGDDHALPPLIILERDEEEPHSNLVVLDSVAQAGCQFRLTNRWPLDQNWLYVDDTGLHARAIDREDPRIAFMALSQVQVELVLECPNDTESRVKRSTNPRLDWLGPYEYGSNKWILTDTILYNSRRSFVNLIVNDINDNYPIFVGNEDEPIICGYPIPELEDIVRPRALAELKATDADVGENAALSFWSSSDVLAVSPTTGSVHIRDGASLTDNQRLVLSVTDLNGRAGGLTTSIELQVKLLDTSNIAVVTVRSAFLDQEETILGNLSSAVGYKVKVLSTAVISDDQADSANARRKREVTAEGASLQLYVYGLIDRVPVAVDQLTKDITESVLSGVDVTSTVSLDDYLEGRVIYRNERDTGLLAATIVLSILLFILMLLIALWFFLRWRKARNYDQFSDANSLASRNEQLESPPKIDSLKKPRLNIDELKRSERRLQEMLDAPTDEVVPKAKTSQQDPEESIDTIIKIAPPRSTEVNLPIVIQSIDKLKADENSGDEDEFGERKNKSRRKSVVTFNENVEKIIHMEDLPDDNSADVEIFKF